MHFQAALSVAIFGASAVADVPQPRQNSCVMCPEVIPECPVCPASQECFITNPSDCTECPQAYCADNAPDATPTPTGILPTPISSSTSSGDFSLPTISESSTTTGTPSSSTTTTTEASTTTTASDGSSTGSGGSATATASAPAASSSAPSSSVAGRNADVAGVLGVALLMAVPILGLQRFW